MSSYPVPLTRTEREHVDTHRILTAMRLALDLDTCRELLNGQPVDPARIDTGALNQAKKQTLVQLVAPIDLLP